MSDEKKPTPRKDGIAMDGEYPHNHRLRAEALVEAGETKDPDGLISEDLIADTKERLENEEAAAEAAKKQAEEEAKAREEEEKAAAKAAAEAEKQRKAAEQKAAAEAQKAEQNDTKDKES